MRSKADVLEVAKAQLSLDYNCLISDFDKRENAVVENKLIEGRRIYESDGCFFKVLCFGGTAIISTEAKMISWCEEKLLKRDAAWFFEYPKLREIDKKLQGFGHEIADVHHYYLPKLNKVETNPTINIKWYEYADILQFKGDNRFQEAFAFDKNHPDMLAVAALDGSNIMGMAGASSDGKTIWQIGIDVLPQYRGRGIGTNLVALLKNEVLRRGKVPFYGTAESHIYSQNIAINAGFFPAWAELYSKKRKTY
ncbi:GNAT family N-acetyltransferase [Hathewaya massiliensis]|uniref:GNAT family N-acetyltransferase n=1 Tax=Hathewaya massiliensis TaxID=1964382 RepID=UPI00115A1240|nr:GNAT family N-acetyltransferase [Hathewaya massiliensis]